MTGPTDWDARYRSGDHPWNHGEASPGLEDFLRETPPQVSTVCVPGCGLGHDVRCFARHGYQATGLDISPTAVGWAREGSRDGGGEFRVGDFLEDEPGRGFELVFEHTLYCAIRPEERSRYAEAVVRWLLPGGIYLANYYLLQEEGGPPFGATREEVLDRFSPRFRLERQWEPRSWPHRKGLEWMALWRLEEPGEA